MVTDLVSYEMRGSWFCVVNSSGGNRNTYTYSMGKVWGEGGIIVKGILREMDHKTELTCGGLV